MQTYAEQRAAYEATRAASAARMKTIMDESAAAGETLNAEQQTEFDTLEKDVEAVDAQIKRLKTLEGLNLSAATEAKGANADEGANARGAVQVRAAPAKVEPGIGFARYVKAMTEARGNVTEAFEIAKANERWARETPDVITCLQPANHRLIKTAVAAGNTTDTTWASPLVQYTNLASEFVEYLRPLTIVGRIPGLRRVPFKVKIPRQTGAASVNWVGEGKVKPVSSLAFDSITLDHHKIAGIVVLTDELVRLSSPAADELVRNDLAAGIVQFMDAQFLDPTKASNDVSPASITYGVTPVTASGTTADAFRADIADLIGTFVDSNLSLAGAVWLMTQSTALRLSLMVNTLGNREFPGLDINGGSLAGIPVITSENVPSTGGSPTDGYMIALVNANDILLADDGQVMIDASREASLQMETTPDSPATASTVLTSLWQHNMVGIRAERMVTWAKRRSEAVGFIQNANYSE
jgi:HK97 family phage major capsid protein